MFDKKVSETMKMKQYCVGRSFQCYTCFVAYLHKVKVDILVKICSSTKKHTKLRPFSRAAMIFLEFSPWSYGFFSHKSRGNQLKSAENSSNGFHLKSSHTSEVELAAIFANFGNTTGFFLKKHWCGLESCHEKHTAQKKKKLEKTCMIFHG